MCKRLYAGLTYYYKASYCGAECNIVQSCMSICALLLLLCGVGWLDDEDALYEEEHGGGVQELKWY